jgi:hypothetical protein
MLQSRSLVASLSSSSSGHTKCAEIAKPLVDLQTTCRKDQSRSQVHTRLAEHSDCRMRTNEDVQQCLAEITNRAAEKAELTKAWVLQLASGLMLRERFVDPTLLRLAWGRPLGPPKPRRRRENSDGIASKDDHLIRRDQHQGAVACNAVNVRNTSTCGLWCCRSEGRRLCASKRLMQCSKPRRRVARN